MCHLCDMIYLYFVLCVCITTDNAYPPEYLTEKQTLPYPPAVVDPGQG